MVLEKIRELVIEQDGFVEFCWEVELNDTLAHGGYVGEAGVAGVVKEGIARAGWIGILLVRGAQTVGELIRGDVGEGQGGI